MSVIIVNPVKTTKLIHSKSTCDFNISTGLENVNGVMYFNFSKVALFVIDEITDNIYSGKGMEKDTMFF